MKSVSDPVVTLFMSFSHLQNSLEGTVTFYTHQVTFLISLDKSAVFCDSADHFFSIVVSFLEFRLEETTVRRSIFIYPGAVFEWAVTIFWVICGYLVLRQVPGYFYYILHQAGDTRQPKLNKCIIISHLEREMHGISHTRQCAKSPNCHGKHSQTSVKNVF